MVFDVDRILLVGQQNALFNAAAPKVVDPNREPAFQPELDGREQGAAARADEIARAGESHPVTGHPEALRKPVQHHESSEADWAAPRSAARDNAA